MNTQGHYDARDPVPCDSCENRRACAVNQLACDLFNRWSTDGVPKKVAWDGKHPTRAQFFKGVTTAREEPR